MDKTFFEAVVIVGMAGITFGIRYLLLGLSEQIVLPPKLSQGLRYVPPTVLTAILIPAIFTPEYGTSWLNPRLWGSLVCLGVGLWRQNLLLTLGSGLATFGVVQWLGIRFGW